MASLTKARARTPAIERGYALAGVGYSNGQMLFTLEVTEPWQPGGKQMSFTAHLSKREVLKIMADWTQKLFDIEPKDSPV